MHNHKESNHAYDMASGTKMTPTSSARSKPSLSRQTISILFILTAIGCSISLTSHKFCGFHNIFSVVFNGYQLEYDFDCDVSSSPTTDTIHAFTLTTNFVDLCTGLRELDVLEVERCDGIQAINITHAFSAIDKLVTATANGVKDKFKVLFTIFPNAKACNNIVEPFNCMVGMNSLIKLMYDIFTIENKIIYGISKNIRRFKQQSFHHLVTLYNTIT